MPALAQVDGVEYAGVGVATADEFRLGPEGSPARGAAAGEGALDAPSLRLAAMLLGDEARVVAARLERGRGLDVDLFGSATLESPRGAVQVSFGMDNDYRCSLDVWGSEASLWTGRVLTAPAGLEPEVVIRRNGAEERAALPADDSFRKSIEHFARCAADPAEAEARRGEILRQAGLVEQVRRLAGWAA